MAKKIKAIVRLQIEAGKANPAPPIGPALAGHGINIMAFCKDYNARTVQSPGRSPSGRNQRLHRWFVHLRPEDSARRSLAAQGRRGGKRFGRTEP